MQHVQTTSREPASFFTSKAAPAPRDPRADDLVRAVEGERRPPGEWPAIGSVPVSVLVPVKNEERNIVECLRRLRFAEQVTVIDSHSTDRTIPLAQAMGAEVYQFDISPQGWPKKKNWALETVPWRHEWVLIMDADEHVTPELAEEVADIVRGQGPGARGRGKTITQRPPLTPDPRPLTPEGYWINRRFMFMGRWIKHCGYYPSWNVRLFKHAVGRYERIGALGDTGSGDNEVHEHVVLSTGDPGWLKNEFLHYAYPDLATWIEKHNRYSTWEAHAMAAKDEGGVEPSLFGGPVARRRWLKAKTRRLPFRPTLRFLYAYILQRGFLDGYPGFVMCRLLAWYDFISLAKHREMRQQGSGVGGQESGDKP